MSYGTSTLSQTPRAQRIEAGHLLHQHVEVRAGRRMERTGAAMSSGAEESGRDLVQQGLEQVMIATVQQCDVNARHVAEGCRRREATEAGAHDDDPVRRTASRLPRHGPGLLTLPLREEEHRAGRQQGRRKKEANRPGSSPQCGHARSAAGERVHVTAA